MIGNLPPSRLVAEAKRMELSPQVTLLSRHTAANEIVAIDLILPMGGRLEPAHQAGIGNLALHMLTRGTRSKSDYEIAVGFESLGASFSAEVQKDRAVISIQTTLHHWLDTLKLVEEVLSEPTFPAEHFEVEKEIIVKEILEDLDSPFYAAGRLFHETLFEGHPYSQSNHGDPETVSALTREAVLEFFDSHFGVGPVTIGVVGNLSIEEAAQALSGISALFTRSREDDFRIGPSLPQHGARERRLKRANDSESIFYGFLVPGLHDPVYPILKVVDSILGGSMDSRLFSEVREKQGLVYQIGSAYPRLEWASSFTISLVTTAPNHDRVLDTLAREVEKIRTQPPEFEEVERAKTYLKGTYLMSQEKNSEQAILLARTHSHGFPLDFIDRYPKLLDEVTPDSIAEVCRKWFQDPTLAIVGPESE